MKKQINRKQIISLVIEKLQAEIKEQENVHNKTRQASIEAPGAMQSHHDTSKEDLGRLADNLEIAVKEKQQALNYFQRLIKRHLGLDKVDVGNLVCVEEISNGQPTGYRYNYFIVEYGGGYQIESDKDQVTLVSVNSPIGNSILGKQKGQSVKISLPNTTKTLKILDIL